MTLTLNAVIKIFHGHSGLYCCAIKSSLVANRQPAYSKKKRKKKKVVFDVADSEPIFLHDTPPHDDIPQYQVWLQIVERFRRYRPDKIGHMDRRTDGRTDGRSDSNTLIYSPVLIPEGRGLTLSEALGTAEVFLQLSKRSFFSLFFFSLSLPPNFPLPSWHWLKREGDQYKEVYFSCLSVIW